MERRTTRIGAVVVTVVLLGLLVGLWGWSRRTSSSAPPAASEVDRREAQWNAAGFDAYAFTYRTTANIGVGLWRIEVRPTGTKVTTVHDPYGGEMPAPRAIGDVFDKVRSAQRDRSSDAIDVKYDPRYGFPAHVSVDPRKQTTDDEYGFGISDLVRLPAG